VSRVPLVRWSKAAVGFNLAAAGTPTGRQLGNPVLVTEGGLPSSTGCSPVGVLVDGPLNATLGWWWADPAAGLVIVCKAVREARTTFADLRGD
jgi:hypothetical protein